MSLTSPMSATTATTNSGGASSPSAPTSSDTDAEGFPALIAGLRDGGAAGAGDGSTEAGATELSDSAAAATDGPASPGSLDLSAWLPGLPIAAGGAAVSGLPVPGEGRGPPGQQPAGAVAAPAADARTADLLPGLDASVVSADGEALGGLCGEAATASAGARGPGDLSSFAATFQRAQGGGVADLLPRGEATGSLREPVGSGAWADELGTRLTVMANQGQYTGSLRLSPEHLGPLEVQIQVGGETTDVFFGAWHADTRAALQEALPRLRELFTAAGLQLGDTGVAHDAPRQDPPAQPAYANPGGSDEERVPASVARAVRAAAVRRHAGLLDTYA
jgi:flagellar hook-length control protein FliK